MRHSIIAATAALFVCSAVSVAQTARPFNSHDLSGNWNMTSRVQTYANVPGGRGGGVEAPFTAAGKAAYEKHKPGYGPRAIPPALGNDPMGTCDPLGIPRNIVTGWAPLHDWIEILQTPAKTVFFIEWHHDYRVVWTDGRQLPSLEDVDPKWNGYSIGKWDGDTFVVDSIGFDDRTWIDKYGYPHTDQMKLQERWRRVDADTLELRMMITDPEYYTRPWESDARTFKLHPEKAKEWDEQLYCAPTEEFRFNQGVRNSAGGVK